MLQVIPTVAVEGDKKEKHVCPVCREEFDTFYKQVTLPAPLAPKLMLLLQVEAEDEGGWYLHNALRTDDGLYHPECHKDKDNAMDTSAADVSVEEGVTKMEIKEEQEKQEVEEAEVAAACDELKPEGCVVKQEEVSVPLKDEDVPMEKEEEAEENKKNGNTDDNANTLDQKENMETEPAEVEPAVEEQELTEEESAKKAEEDAIASASGEALLHSTSLVADAVDGKDNSMVAIPSLAKVVFQPGRSSLQYLVPVPPVSASKGWKYIGDVGDGRWRWRCSGLKWPGAERQCPFVFSRSVSGLLSYLAVISVVILDNS